MVYRDSLVYVSNENVVEVEKQLSGWQKTMQAGGYILMGLIVAAAVFVALKIFKKI